MKDISDFLWGMYQEHTSQGRHHETQRASVTNFIIIVATASLGFIANRGVSRDQWTFALFLIIIGLFGALFSAKQYERFRYHMEYARKYREVLENLLNNGLTNIRSQAKLDHRKKHSSFLVNLHLHFFWTLFHLLISAIGVILLIMTLLKPSHLFKIIQ